MKNYSILLLCLLAISGCSVVRQKGAPDNLKETKWVLVRMGQDTLNASDLGRSLPTLEFDTAGTRVFGNAGCNRYNGAVEISGDSIKFGPLMSTKMACEHLDLEQKFMGYMQAEGMSYALKKDKLTLSSDSGLLEFEPAGE